MNTATLEPTTSPATPGAPVREFPPVPDLQWSEALQTGDARMDATHQEMVEMLARLRALLRRAGGTAAPTLSHAGVVLEPASKRVTLHGRPVSLSAREYALLYELLRHRRQTRSRAQLEESLYAWGEETGSNTVEVYVHHLRRKLGADFIRTIRGFGYRIGDPA